MSHSGSSQTALRTRARRLAMQALYQWNMSGNNLDDIEAQFLEDEDFTKADKEYFHELLHQVPARLDEVEAAFTPYLDRPLKEIDPVERALLRMASYELLARIDIPYKVIINESVNLTKKFGAEQAYKYINGVLDKTAQSLRTVEHPKGQGGSGLLKK
ncbi:Transcription termination protein NusB [hydrothermal vent metagenome]|uniref:Transcription termination protein NusB n=1 Tax=hydrothermal vent metagenome TaxID=652676 RepID=A0A3B0ZBM2_9ZZZZ